MTELDERPAVPPMDPGGDERIGLYATGILFIVLGWGFAIAVNLLVHLTAPSNGLALGPIVITQTLGSFAWVTFGIGLFTGLLGAGFLWVARDAPQGPVVLPGYPYPEPT